MTNKTHSKIPDLSFKIRQRGASLLLFFFLIFGVFTTAFLYATSPIGFKMREAEKTQGLMREAKEALIAYAVTHTTIPGRLPCPEDPSFIGTANEGYQMSSCSNSGSTTGRLPWRSLGLDNPANTGEPLWYIRSQGFESSPINSNSIGQIQLDGIPNTVVALIIAPGNALSGQNRTAPSASSPPSAINYLDLSNATGPAYLSKGPADTFNDIVLAISTKELFNGVEKRVVKEARVALEKYYTTYGYYPNPAKFTDTNCLANGNITSLCVNDPSSCTASVCRGRIPATLASPAVVWPASSILRGTIGSAPNWLQKNGWRELILYAVSPNCAEAACAAGTLTIQTPNQILTGLKSILILGGASVSNQSRTNSAEKTIESNYFEDKNISPPDNIFTTFTNASFNDVAAWQP